MGASGTGKTTLAKALAERFSLPMAEEDFGEIVAVGHELSRLSAKPQNKAEVSDGIKKYAAACSRWLERRARFQKENPAFVMDRCCFDLLTRWIKVCTQLQENDRLLKSLIRTCQQQSSEIDLITVLPLHTRFNIPRENEEGLSRDQRMSRRISRQASIIGLTQQFSMAPILLMPSSEGSIDARVDKITTALQDIAKKSSQ